MERTAPSPESEYRVTAIDSCAPSRLANSGLSRALVTQKAIFSNYRSGGRLHSCSKGKDGSEGLRVQGHLMVEGVARVDICREPSSYIPRFTSDRVIVRSLTTQLRSTRPTPLSQPPASSLLEEDVG